MVDYDPMAKCRVCNKLGGFKRLFHVRDKYRTIKVVALYLCEKCTNNIDNDIILLSERYIIRKEYLTKRAKKRDEAI